MYMELDNSLKELTTLVRERRKFKNALSDKILNFMARFNIDDLNTKDGRLKYKMSNVRTPLPTNLIKKRVEEVLVNEVPREKCDKITAIVFSRDTSTKPSLSLRKIKIS
jgi:hypothetical protein